MLSVGSGFETPTCAPVSPVQAARLPPDRPPALLPGLLRSALPPSIRHFKDATLRQPWVDCCCCCCVPPDRRLLSDTAGGKEGTFKPRPCAVEPLFSGRLLCSAFRDSWLTPPTPQLVHRCCLCRPAPTLPGWLAGWLSAPFFSENQEAACPTYAQSPIGSGRALGEETAGVGRAHRGRRGRVNTGVRPWCYRPAAVSVARSGGGKCGEGQL